MKRVMILACVVDDDEFTANEACEFRGLPVSAGDFVEFASNAMADSGVAHFVVWSDPEDFVSDHQTRGPITAEYLQGGKHV